MSQSVAPNPQADVDRLETAADEAIAACGGDVRDALKGNAAPPMSIITSMGNQQFDAENGLQPGDQGFRPY